MANQGKGSRWGSLLSQAVAGMEAHLDNMLAEGEGGPNATKQAQGTSGNPHRQSATVQAKNVPASPRTSSSSNRVNDRLQERLAKAIATKGGSNATEVSSTITNPIDFPNNKASTTSENSAENQAQQLRGSESPQTATVEAAVIEPLSTNETHSTGVDDVRDEAKHHGADSIELEEEHLAINLPPSSEVTTTPLDSLCSRCRSLDVKISTLEAEHRGEVHRYIEQVDALQAKLQYLSREASQVARNAIKDTQSGTLERKLAEKDERIAVLMEEGRGMAATEQKHRNVIKKLRIQVADNEKANVELKAALQQARAGLADFRASEAKLEQLEKARFEWQVGSAKMREELSLLRSDLSAKQITIDSLRQDLQKAMDEADTSASRALADALEAEKRRAREFEDNIASLQVEKNLVAERAKKREAELREKADEAAERSRIAQLELQGEMQAIEGRLEAMRALAEEASSGAVGDSQAKLLRQMETLQTQHAIASENWQGIEASLATRLSNLEKERNDALRRESDMRKKARETALRCKRQEEEIHDLSSRISNSQPESDQFKDQLVTLQKRAEAAEAALAQAKADFEKQQASWKAERWDHPDRRLWLEDVPVASPRIQSRPDSPLLSVPVRTFSSDLLVSQGPSGKGRKISTPGSVADGFHDSFSPGRRLSSQPPLRPFVLPNSAGLSSSVSMASFDPPREGVQTATSHLGERDDISDVLDASSSPRQMMQDMVSVSTVGAGPSVQLVERMSAAIRRLEGEKMASREELSRISGQRDEARAELVALMKETQSAEATSRKVSDLEDEVANINERYQTTLELLGEKSELVEELRADVEDVKAMYRDLVERTVKG
ncbi:TATA element modulatory factor 1 TATA binding-domain-containing protein [Verticillium dahliae]|nr:TATA element modulatory factor 1 TATA binding-domain-containing protein [Verticillium dahliae]